LVLFFDNGIPPAISVKFKQELNLGDGKFGMLGSMIFVGQCIGSFLSSPILQKINAKYVLIFALTVDIVTLTGFCLFDSFVIMAGLRVATGIMQVFFTVYLPVWADSFGTDEEKPGWFALLIISNPLGTIVGYAVAAFVQDSLGWRYAFYIQCILLVPCMAILIYMPETYYDVKVVGK